ncbi:MAG: UvrB/UvrC motif-containing protein, partial [Atopobiaceae bacterium]|nr:UvrB/UvrC motif-containing protein [Atopobiaceae bacterium]
QERFNEEHGIEPATVRKAISDISSFIEEAAANVDKRSRSKGDELGHGAFFTPAASGIGDAEGTSAAEALAAELSMLPKEEVLRIIDSLEQDMAAASEDMDFERAAALRDQIVELKVIIEGSTEEEVMKRLKQGARKGSAHATRRRWRPKH